MFIQKISGSDIKKQKVPRVKDIIKARKRKIYQDLAVLLEKQIDEKYLNWAEKLIEDRDPKEVLSAVLNYCFEDDLNPDNYGEIQEPGMQDRGQQIDRQGRARLFVALGRKDKMSARKLVDLVLSRVDMRPRDISDIQVMDRFSFLTVPFDKAEKIIAGFREKGKKPLIIHARKN
jgi:ATP-dependent RNA helicase DeaD